ncbi:MAG: hypothetical protein WCL60_10865 [Methylococcales bacterium]
MKKQILILVLSITLVGCVMTTGLKEINDIGAFTLPNMNIRISNDRGTYTMRTVVEQTIHSIKYQDVTHDGSAEDIYRIMSFLTKTNHFNRIDDNSSPYILTIKHTSPITFLDNMSLKSFGLTIMTLGLFPYPVSSHNEIDCQLIGAKSILWHKKYVFQELGISNILTHYFETPPLKQWAENLANDLYEGYFRATR